MRELLGYKEATIFARAGRAAASLSAFLAIFLVCRSIVSIRRNYFIIPHWDQWEILRTLASPTVPRAFARFLFTPHGSHVVATGNFILWLDLWLFSGTNVFPVILISTINLLLAFLLFHTACREWKSPVGWILLGAFSISALSLAQWENLLWAFQVPFVLVNLAAFGCIMLATSIVDFQSRWRLGGLSLDWLKFTLYLICLFAAIASLADGVLIGAALLIILLANRARSISLWCNIIVPWAAMTVGFLILVHGTSDVGDPSLRTFVKCLVFFLALLGAPLTSSLPWSCGLGGIVLAASTATVVWALAAPMLKGTANDARLTALAAYVSFLLLSLLAVTWGRVGYGIGFAFSSRYTTITLLLWMSSFGTIFRYLSIRKKLGDTPNPFIIAAASLAFIAASGSTLRPHNSAGIRHYSERTRQAAYFLVSGVLSDDILSWIYPSPSLIRPSIATLRDRHLGIFSDRWGLSVPARLALGAPLGENPKCPLGAVDRITSEGEYGWKVEGWTADPIHKTAPELVLAYNVYGRLLGFSEPLVERADVQAFLKNSTIFFGFIVPLSGILERPFLSLGSDEIRLVAVFSGGYSCLMKGELKG